MKSSILIALLTSIVMQSFSQSVHKARLTDKTPPKSYHVDGTPLLGEQYRQAAEYMRSHPDYARKAKLEKTASWNFQMGSTHSWWVYNVATHLYYLDPSTCRGGGTHCYIFVEDSLWTNGRIDQAAVDSIENDFDDRTPANSSKGIYDMDVGAFGNPPDVDSDPKIIMLICNIQDGYTGSGGYVAGFFDPRQETGQSYSNQAEIYYVDANPTDLKTPDGLQIAMSTAAHEFQHMINWNYHQTTTEPTFINEGCSMLAELYCGYPADDLSLYANETNHYLFDWRTYDNTLVLNDYSRAQRFNLYLWDRYGIGLFKYIVASTQLDPVAILNDAFSKDGLSITFNGIFTNWLIANELNDTTSNRLYGYAYPNLPTSAGPTFYNPNVSASDTVQLLGARYLIFKGGSNLNVTFSNPSSSSNLSVQAIEIGNESKIVVNVPFGAPFSERGFGSTYNVVAFAVINDDSNNPIVYSYQANGTAINTTVELKWDNTEPTAYVGLAPNDTLCVTFDAYPGGTLDSIRVALRRAGFIVGGVYEFTGTQRPSPLGRILARDTATTTINVSLTPQHKYPVPWPNWATVELGANNISTDQPFAVAFVAGPVDTVPGIMLTDFPGQNAYHSYTYLNASEASPDPAGWFYFGDGTNISLYLIRAYVHFTTGITQEVAPVPIQFSLEQNFPNPFNPMTVISYQLAAVSQVTLRVYDILGREVAVLVNKREGPGHFSIDFDASALPSGVYFYRLTTAENTAVKKMVLIK